jgi:hypothetical protein
VWSCVVVLRYFKWLGRGRAESLTFAAELGTLHCGLHLLHSGTAGIRQYSLFTSIKDIRELGFITIARNFGAHNTNCS